MFFEELRENLIEGNTSGEGNHLQNKEVNKPEISEVKTDVLSYLRAEKQLRNCAVRQRKLSAEA